MSADGVSSRVTLEIDLQAIRRNYRKIHKRVSPLSVMAVLKANAYGLGVLPIAQALKEENVPFFGVAEPKEALEIAHLNVPTLILGSVLPEELPSLVGKPVILPISSEESAWQISVFATEAGEEFECHLLVDTGMGRLGVPKNAPAESFKEIFELPGLKISGIYSHFPSAYADQEFSNHQCEELIRVRELIEGITGAKIPHLHIGNSDGIHNIPDSIRQPFDIVRTGINLYGCFDLEGRQSFSLENAVSILSKLVAIRTLPEGSTIGYGRTYTLEKPTKIGTVSIGYADGLPLYFSGKGHLTVHGKRCPILGRTSMDYTTIDLSEVPQAKIGDPVICLGNGAKVSDWARAKGTIPYEVIVSIGNRVERIYKD